MSNEVVPHWVDVLTLRPEVRSTEGSVGELQMSLHKVAFGSVDVPYRKPAYYSDITQPTPNLVGFLGTIARRLGSATETRALFHLDQGMGGGKSHALVGLFHMAAHASEFFATPLGKAVAEEARSGGVDVDLAGAKVVSLTADHFSPGKRSDAFGPATTLFERFVWSLVSGNMDDYQRYVAMGPNKSTLQQALTEAGEPVLVLLDELMDYVMQLSDASVVSTMPGEKAFLNSLMDACDDVPHVAFVVVMIRSEYDERGYPFQAQDFRDYVSARLERNGRTVAVTEAQDFAAIIRRRLFEQHEDLPAVALAQSFTTGLDAQWKDVYDRLGANRGTIGFPDRVVAVYPFHPELMRVVREEWAQVQGFQRVRSTVAIFARTVLHWVTEHQEGRWAPALIGPGDIPLTMALEEVLSSGLLLGNDRAIQGYRAVASTDITSTDGSGGRAVGIDQTLRDAAVDAHQPAPATRMATALLTYSLVGRAQARRGATKAELLASIHEPGGVPFTAAEEVFNALTDDTGLGALELTTAPNAPARYYLSIKQTLRMYFTAAAALVTGDDRETLVWNVAQRLANKGVFDDVVCVERPAKEGTPLSQVFAQVDSTTNRLVVLDPRRWTLLNGKDSASREDIRALLGQGPDAVTVDNAASCVVACVNTQRRKTAYSRAADVLAWRYVLRQLDDDTDGEVSEAKSKLAEAETRLNTEVAKAFQHYAYLLREGDGLVVEFKRFDDDARTALRGSDVWTQLVADARATVTGSLGGAYLAALLATFDRDLTPSEIVRAFYKNPSFPLVPSTDEIRTAIYQLVAQGEWELADAQGHPLVVTSAGQIQINSINQTLRRRAASAPGHEDAADTAQATTAEASGLDGTITDGITTATSTTTTPGPVEYKRYRVLLANRSITSEEARDKVWQLLRELSKVVDPASNHLDHQLISLDVTLTTAAGDVLGLESRVEQAEAKLTVENDDF
ncbi:DUF499 domain-containing protein [Agromyces bauzanensis]